MLIEPAVIGSKGLTGPINFPTNRPIIPYLLKKILPLVKSSGYLMKGQTLDIEFLNAKPMK